MKKIFLTSIAAMLYFTAFAQLTNPAWELTGNKTTATKKLGTTSNQDISVVTNNLERILIKKDANITFKNPSTNNVYINSLGQMGINVNTFEDAQTRLKIKGINYRIFDVNTSADNCIFNIFQNSTTASLSLIRHYGISDFYGGTVFNGPDLFGDNIGTGAISLANRKMAWSTDGSGYNLEIGKYQSSTFTPYLTLKDNGTSYFSSLLGVGTSTPDAYLQVKGVTDSGEKLISCYSTGLAKNLLQLTQGAFQVHVNKTTFFSTSGGDTELEINADNGGATPLLSFYSSVAGATTLLIQGSNIPVISAANTNRIRVSSNVGINTAPDITQPLVVLGISEYADNAAAVAAGLPEGSFYRTGDTLKVVH